MENPRNDTTASTGQSGGLRAGAMGLPGLIAVAVGGVAPEYSILLVGSVVGGIAGGATPAAFLIASIGMLAFGVVMASLSRHVAAAGGLYSFATKGLGRDVGYLTGWLYLGIGIIITPATFISTAFLIQNFFAAVLPHSSWLSSTWVWWAFILTALVLAAVHFGVRVSVVLLLSLTAIGVVSIVLMDFFILFQGGKSGIAWSALNPFDLHGASVESLLLGVGLAVTCMAGSEGGVFMAEEVRNPRKTVPKGVMGTMGLVVVFYLLTSLAITTGLGVHGTSHWGLLGAGVVQTLANQYMVSWFGSFLILVVALAGITGCLGFTNYMSRLIFEWGRDRHLPVVFARTHARFDTPTLAIVVLGIIGGVGYIISVLWKGGSAAGGLAAFSWMYEVDAVILALVYPIVAIAGAAVGYRTKASPWVTYVAPTLVVILIGISIKAQFFPFPASPLNVAVYAALGWLVCGGVLRFFTRGRTSSSEAFGEEIAAFEDAGGPGESRLPG
ncbi:APC family permease [Leekyejoonella antrihumi]|nr:APC family permease [Leekyejoonella antrihumi]